MDINTDMLEGTRDELNKRYPQVEVLIMPINVTDEASVETAVNRTVEHFGSINIAVNCAGIGGTPSKTSDMSLQDWQKVIDVNQTGVWLCQRAEIRQMLKQE